MSKCRQMNKLSCGKKINGVSLEKNASAPLARPMSKPIYINLLGLSTFRFGTLRLIKIYPTDVIKQCFHEFLVYFAFSLLLVLMEINDKIVFSKLRMFKKKLQYCIMNFCQEQICFKFIVII